jgi:hypothetical protein
MPNHFEFKEDTQLTMSLEIFSGNPPFWTV